MEHFPSTVPCLLVFNRIGKRNSQVGPSRTHRAYR
jgi:hypothetical protein